MKKVIRERFYSFLENNLAVGFAMCLIAAGGIGAAWAKFEALTSATPL
jgi:hypothetical protein